MRFKYLCIQPSNRPQVVVVAAVAAVVVVLVVPSTATYTPYSLIRLVSKHLIFIFNSRSDCERE